jgi:hypothetical protein
MKNYSITFVVLSLLAYIATMFLKTPHSVGFHYDGDKKSLHRAIVRVTINDHSDLLQSAHIANNNSVIMDKLYIINDQGLITFRPPWQDKISNYIFSYRYRYIVYPAKLYNVTSDRYEVYSHSSQFSSLQRQNHRNSVKNNVVELLDVNRRLTRVGQIDFSLYDLKMLIKRDQGKKIGEILSIAIEEMNLLCSDIPALRKDNRIKAKINIDYLGKRCEETNREIKLLSRLVRASQPSFVGG